MLKHLLEQRAIGNREFLPLSGQALLGFRLLPGAVRFLFIGNKTKISESGILVLYAGFRNLLRFMGVVPFHESLIGLSSKPKGPPSHCLL